MRVLVACEYSGRVRQAFRDLGHDAWSCDLLPSEDNSPYHIQGDIVPILDQGWDLMVAHPPCTYLAVSGLHWNKKDPERAEKTEEALEFVRLLMNAPIPRIAIENPRVLYLHQDQEAGSNNSTLVVWRGRKQKDMPVVEEPSSAGAYQQAPRR